MVRKTSGLSAGDYLIATDSKGCTDTETITIGYGDGHQLLLLEQ
jgi:hypothetical protein